MRRFVGLGGLMAMVLAVNVAGITAASDARGENGKDRSEGRNEERGDERGRPGKVRSGQAASLLYFINPELGCLADNPCFGYEPVYDRRGRPIGRLVPLNGDIDGLNFEPGVCAQPADLGGGLLMYCLPFGNGEPGTFTRARSGNAALTRCFCTVGGKGDSLVPDFPLVITDGDRAKALWKYESLRYRIEDSVIDSFFTLSIKYFDPSAAYPAGHTEFRFINGTDRLEDLEGAGILDFAGNPPISFKYRFEN